MKKFLATYGKPRFLGIIQFEDEQAGIEPGQAIVAVSHRGEEVASVIGTINDMQEKEYRSLRTISEHGEGPVRGGDPVVTDMVFVRFPDTVDRLRHEEHTLSEDSVLKVARELVEWHKLPIKLVDAEFLLDEKKLFFYFTSDQRVDFRMLVKDLARRFKTRIELRQTGVRDEARIIKGLSSCGLPCCCSYWLNQFVPIGIRMVKEQNIALNPAKISGICGRLMCCMSYEHKAYKELWEGMPGPGSKIKTPNGNYIVISIDVAKEALRCHRPGGGDILVPLGMFADFKQAIMAGEAWEPPQPQEAETGDAAGLGFKQCPKSRAVPAAPRAQETVAAPDGQAASGKETEEDKKAPGQKRSRRRGRRGGRSRSREIKAAAPAEQPEKKPQESDKSRRRRPGKPAAAKTPGEDRHTGTEPRAVPEQEGADGKQAPRRPRRHRRRPRKQAAPRDETE